MRLFLRRFPALAWLRFLGLFCSALAIVGTVEATTLLVTSAADSGSGSLRDTIAGASDGDTIQFDPALNGQAIILTGTELAIGRILQLMGLGPIC